MKIRLTISAIAFALALARMSVRGHTCAAALDTTQRGTNVANYPAVPATRALPPTHRPSPDGSSLGPSGVLSSEEGESAQTTRSTNPQR